MNHDKLQRSLHTLESRQFSKQFKSKNRNQAVQSPYLHKLYTKPSSSNATPSSMNRPILSLTRKLQMDKINNKFQSTLTNFQTYKYKENRFCDTVTNGFIINQRPVSKQQSRSRIGESGFNKKQYEELIVTQMDDFDNEGNSEWDNDKLICVKLNRPETSKGERNRNKKEDKEKREDKARRDAKNSNKSCEKEVQTENEVIESQFPNKVYRAHPSSAVERSKVAMFDDLIKVNTKPLDSSKLKKTSNLPFTSLIDHDFLSLFANNEQL